MGFAGLVRASPGFAGRVAVSAVDEGGVGSADAEGGFDSVGGFSRDCCAFSFSCSSSEVVSQAVVYEAA